MHKLFNDFFERQFRAIILTVLKTICLRFKIRLWQLEEVFLETAVVIGLCSVIFPLNLNLYAAIISRTEGFYCENFEESEFL